MWSLISFDSFFLFHMSVHHMLSHDFTFHSSHEKLGWVCIEERLRKKKEKKGLLACVTHL